MHVVLLHGNGACRENKRIKKTHTRTHPPTHAHTHTHTHTHQKHKSEVLFVMFARNFCVWGVYLVPEPFSLKFKPGKHNFV